MWIFDTSSFIAARFFYPINQFPSVWGWLREEIRAGRIQAPQVAWGEIRKVDPDCGEWLSESGIHIVPSSGEILKGAEEIKKLLNTNFQGKGVSENDLIIVGTARHMGKILVSDEAVQSNLPREKSKYKIPAVCDLPSVNVRCINLNQFIRSSGQVF